MVDISYPQYKMLKRINKTESIDVSSLTDEEKKICDFLSENGFVSYKSNWRYEESNLSYAPFIPHAESSKFEITEKGKAQISAYKSTFYNLRSTRILAIISTILSAISTIVSIIALLKP